MASLFCRIFKHKWNDWKYIALDSCEQKRSCCRCGEMETRSKIHKWYDWEYIASDSCEQKRTCSRCGEMETRSDCHNWGDWTYTDPSLGKQMRVCTRCDKAEYRRQTEECQYCGETFYRGDGIGGFCSKSCCDKMSADMEEIMRHGHR